MVSGRPTNDKESVTSTEIELQQYTKQNRVFVEGLGRSHHHRQACAVWRRVFPVLRGVRFVRQRVCPVWRQPRLATNVLNFALIVQ